MYGSRATCDYFPIQNETMFRSSVDCSLWGIQWRFMCKIWIEISLISVTVITLQADVTDSKTLKNETWDLEHWCCWTFVSRCIWRRVAGKLPVVCRIVEPSPSGSSGKFSLDWTKQWTAVICNLHDNIPLQWKVKQCQILEKTTIRNVKRSTKFDTGRSVYHFLQYTGYFTTLGHNCRRWFPRSLWSKKFI